MKNRICFIGLSREVVQEITKDFYGNIIHHDFIPKIIVNKGQLYVERRNGVGMLSVFKNWAMPIFKKCPVGLEYKFLAGFHQSGIHYF